MGKACAKALWQKDAHARREDETGKKLDNVGLYRSHEGFDCEVNIEQRW